MLAFCVGDPAGTETAQRPACGLFTHGLGRFEQLERAGGGVPVVALHAAGGVLRDGYAGDGAAGTAVLAAEATRVHHDLVAGAGVEAAAVGVLDAGVGGESRLFGAARQRDAVFAGERVDVVEAEREIAFELAELACIGQAGEGIFTGDLRKRHGAADELGDGIFGEVRGRGGGDALAVEDPQPDAA